MLRITSGTIKGLGLLLAGFIACWCLFGVRTGAQTPPTGNGFPVPAGQVFPQSEGKPQIDNSALMAGTRTVPITRPLEVPPLYAFDCMVSETCQQIVIVDSETKRICVYHVRPQGNQSTVEMVASRNFQWDLKLDDFNGTGITPAQIREQIQRKEVGKP